MNAIVQSATLVTITRAIEHLTTAMRGAVTGGDTAEPIAWARQELSKLDLVPAVPAVEASDFFSEVPKGFNTVLGYLFTTDKRMLDLMEDPVRDTTRDGWWLMHRCKERGTLPVRVPAPRVCQLLGIVEINAYPVDLLERRFG